MSVVTWQTLSTLHGPRRCSISGPSLNLLDVAGNVRGHFWLGDIDPSLGLFDASENIRGQFWGVTEAQHWVCLMRQGRYADSSTLVKQHQLLAYLMANNHEKY